MKEFKIEKSVYPITIKKSTTFKNCKRCGSHLIYVETGFENINFKNDSKYVNKTCLRLICAECRNIIETYILEEEIDVLKQP
jgi:hypothetical protein